MIALVRFCLLFDKSIIAEPRSRIFIILILKYPKVKYATIIRGIFELG